MTLNRLAAHFLFLSSPAPLPPCSSAPPLPCLSAPLPPRPSAQIQPTRRRVALRPTDELIALHPRVDRVPLVAQEDGQAERHHQEEMQRLGPEPAHEVIQVDTRGAGQRRRLPALDETLLPSVRRSCIKRVTSRRPTSTANNASRQVVRWQCGSCRLRRTSTLRHK
jgi:hypothetical protein